MLKQIVIIVAAVVVLNGVLLFSGALDRLIQTEETVSTPPAVSTDISDVFYFTLTDEVDKRLGQPEEGYQPDMFLAVFPGLVETDFDGVAASGGRYQVVDGRIQYQPDDSLLGHGASQAVSRKGVLILLDNIATRTGIDLRRDGTITDIMSVLTKN